MAKGKSSNPADAYRKQQRAKEVKRNKEARNKIREEKTVKTDTGHIEAEIRSLKAQSNLKADSKTRLAELESELAYVTKTKEKYVSEHPEARDRIFKPRREGHGDGQGDGGGARGTGRGEDLSHLYDEQGRLRDPKRSLYYDEVYNPWGVPPPGMPYQERGLPPGMAAPPDGGDGDDDDEHDNEDGDGNDDDEDEDDDDEIIMPSGPPPAPVSEADSDDSDDIPLPPGPPPPKPPTLSQPPIPSFPARPLPLPFAPPLHLGFGPPQMRPPTNFHPPQHQQQGFRPRPPPARHGRPPATVQDPLSDAPTQTYQGYRMEKHQLPSRPDAPPSAVGNGAPPAPVNPAKAESSASAAGEISAAPVMRDLRKEATAFVPRGVKRKKPVGGVQVNAAPGRGEVDQDGDEVKRVEEGGGLMGKLRGVIGAGSGFGPGARVDVGGGGGGKEEDDYQKFLDGLGGLE